MISAPLRALILDLDGVILDSNAIKTRAFEAVFSRFPAHAAAMMEYHERHVSQSRFEKFRHLVEERLGRQGDDALVEELASEFARVLRERMEACPFVPGARALLDEMAGRIPLYLASVTPEAELQRLLDVHRIRQYFDRVFGCPPWTKTDAVGVIVAALGGPHGLALVGDSAGDQRAAAVHGVEFVARDSGLAFDPPVSGIRDVAVIASLLRNRIAA